MIYQGSIAERKIASYKACKRFPVTCVTCHATFFSTRKRSLTAKFCSMACTTTARQHGLINTSDVIKPRNPIVQFACATCGKAMVERARKHRPKPMFCSYKCQGFSKKLAWPISTRAANLRVWMRKHSYMTHCERCGYKQRPDILTIHHKDRNRMNNTKENIEVLCPNCHAMEHIDEHKDGWKNRRHAEIVN